MPVGTSNTFRKYLHPGCPTHTGISEETSITSLFIKTVSYFKVAITACENKMKAMHTESY
jgi:hypothetical protein